jgi:hypothetical protein
LSENFICYVLAHFSVIDVLALNTQGSNMDICESAEGSTAHPYDEFVQVLNGKGLASLQAGLSRETQERVGRTPEVKGCAA